MKKIYNILSAMNMLSSVIFIGIFSVLQTMTSIHQALAQTKSVVVTDTLSAQTGLSYHALENMMLDAGFKYDSDTSGVFYVETGDFVNAAPSYGSNRNKVITEIARDSTSIADTLDAWGPDQKHTIIRYSDGLGRGVQSIYQQGSPLGKDMIQHAQYDPQGRGSKGFLPYVGTTTNGSFHASASTEQLNFYDNSSDDIADSDVPYAETEFDDSPLNRVLRQGAPGDDWQLSTSNVPEFEFKTNDASEVRKFTSSGTSTTYWAADQLTVSEITDENGHRVEQYRDRFGRLLLKKVEQDSAIWSSTYHLYDLLGRLKYTIQPEGYQKMVTDSNYNVSHVEDDYVFAYLYDDRGRLVEKIVPGSDPVYFIYDALDRLVLSQDGLLRESNSWNFIRYDHKNRVVMTGLHVDNTDTTRAQKQDDIDGFNYGTNNHFEDRNSATPHGYTSRTYPTGGTNTDHIVFYYDDYDFDGTAAEQDYTYISKGYGNIVDYEVINRPTATKQKVLDGSDWLWSITFYDRKGRAIQTRSNNHLQDSIHDISTVKYHFDGRIEKTNRYVDAGSGNTVEVDNRYVYDNGGRLTEVYQDIDDSGTEQQVAAYNYNELGQLIEKELHGDGTDFLQSVDYRYNIRGWMTQINGSDLAATGMNTGDDHDDIFGMDLLYNSTETGINNTAFYNGNISAVKWQTDDVHNEGAKRERSYAFTYDRSDRLTDALFKAHNGTNWTTEEQGSYDVTGISYDRNGNIQGLKRYYQANDSSSRAAIDDLVYTYSANRLTKVEDSEDDALGYIEGTGQTTEYTYDANGNILTDTNKDLTYSYNALNKTKKVQYNANKYIAYTYSASGARIKKHVYDSANSIDETWNYINGFVFKDSNIDHFAMHEGVVRKVDGDYRYEYFLTDHQGNTRMSFTNGQDEYLATMESENETSEEAVFGDLDDVRVAFGSANVTSGGNEAARLNNSNPFGPSLSLKVSKGDKIDMEVWGYYEGGSGYSSTVGMTGFIASLASIFGGVNGGTSEQQSIFDGINDAFAGLSSLNGTQGDDYPAAYLNYIFVDDNYDFTAGDAGYTQIIDNGGTWTKDKIDLSYTAPESGYIYVYTSLESDVSTGVHFDDLKITHHHVEVLQENHYYPFGLSMEGVVNHVPTPSSTTANKYLYNQGSEMQELDIRNYDTPFRQYDPALGRFQAVDPIASAYSNQTPYQYGNNDPIYYSDPLGLFPEKTFQTIFDQPHDDGSGIPDFGTGFDDWFAYGGSYMHGGGGFFTDGYESRPGKRKKRKKHKKKIINHKWFRDGSKAGSGGTSYDGSAFPGQFFFNSRSSGYGSPGERGLGPGGPGYSEREDSKDDVYGGPQDGNGHGDEENDDDLLRNSGRGVLYDVLWFIFEEEWLEPDEDDKNIELTTKSGTGGHDAPKGSGDIVYTPESAIEDEDFIGFWKGLVGPVKYTSSGDSTFGINPRTGKAVVVPKLTSGGTGSVRYGAREATETDSINFGLK